MNPPATISNAPLDNPAMDFEFLRSEGIKHIQKLAGKLWTDHNTHDPGITILDQLCYALTDLSYRIGYEIKDLLAEKDGHPYKSLFSPAEILTVNPVTVSDIRKVVIDVEGVKNAWVEKTMQPQPEVYFNRESKTLLLTDEEGAHEPVRIKGLYLILIEKNEATSKTTEIQPGVKARLNACRNLCEDFSEIKILAPQLITIEGNIELGHVEDINTFAASTLFRLANFISPQVRFYTLEELLNKGRPVDEIFDGPILNHGFIDDEELKRSDRKTELHTSDIIRVMMDEPGALAVNNISLITGSAAPERWRLVLDNQKTPKLDLDLTLTTLNFLKNEMKVGFDKEKVKQLFYEMRDANLYFPLAEKQRNIRPAVRDYRNIDRYYSIQNHFQEVYGIGEFGLPESALPGRKARAKQLKAYLMFFEQILAGYFSQVAHAKDLFSFYKNEPLTYFNQSLIGRVPGASEVLYIGQDEVHDKRLAEITENTNAALERKNRFLNHLVARFSESLTDYSLWLYDELIRNPANQQAGGPASVDASATLQKLVNDKLNFLKDYPLISNNRGKAFDYTTESWNTGNISGLAKRIAAKLGFENFYEKPLADNNQEGFHLVEHILLRPAQEDLYKFSEYLVPKDIQVFEKSDRADWVRCISELHGLQSGEVIQIRGSSGYNGIHKTDRVLPNSFEIKTPFVGPGNVADPNDEFGEKTPAWIRTTIDTRFLMLTRPVLSFSASATSGFTVCEALEHGLENGDIIEIIATSNYNGIYKVQRVRDKYFEIEKAFTQPETTGRWISEYQRKDPFSLQLSFVFPDWPQRFQNANFRAFTENTIREETPVHLTVYIQWLNKEAMQVFENAYKNLINTLKDA